uniref:Uncharacterized protein n=1 Tax=Hyaloperonospora arabidopsidis (strain Emoy2) TaxID=559515 RepID=M4C2S3_HYAAE
MGACFPMSLLRHRMYLVILVDETLNVNHQLGASRPAIVRRWIVAPVNKITRSMPLHVTVVQDTLHFVYTICVIAPKQRGRSVSLWRRGCNASAFIDRTTDRSSRSTNWRTSGLVKSFATKRLTFVARMLLYRARLRSWLGTKRISWRFMNVAVVFARGRYHVVMVRAETTDIKRRMTVELSPRQ